MFLCIGLEALLMGKDDPIAGNCWNCSKISGNCRRKYKIKQKGNVIVAQKYLIEPFSLFSLVISRKGLSNAMCEDVYCPCMNIELDDTKINVKSMF